jgi:hypothetical protein
MTGEMALFRWFLGMAQITGSTMALVFLFRTGLSPLFWVTFAVTTIFTITSRILFWRGKHWKSFFTE